MAAELKKPPLKDEVETLAQLMTQDLEPDPGGGGVKIREGVAPDRRVSLGQPLLVTVATPSCRLRACIAATGTQHVARTLLYRATRRTAASQE